MITITIKIPIKDDIKKYSAVRSSLLSRTSCLVLIAKKDKTQDTVSNNAITLVDSSTIEFCVLSVMCKEVITNKQNPKRFAAVFKM